MRATKNAFGLYEFAIKARGPKKSKILKGLVDTGSTDCAVGYEVITTLWARPIDFKPVSTIDGSNERRLIYALNIGFDQKSLLVPIVRVTRLPIGVHLLLGMSLLSKCKITTHETYLDINWL